MKPHRRHPILRLLPAVIALAFSVGASAGTYTYDGRLDDAGQPANGVYDMQITAWAAAEQGRTLAPAITFPGVAVRDGRFHLEFEAPLGERDQAWLELGVRDGPYGAEFSTIPGRVKAASATAVIGQCWSATGDAGSDAATNFLGTTDAQALVLRTNNVAGLRLLPAVANVVSMIGGSPANVIGATVIGGVVAGGGTSVGGENNQVFDDMGTLSGGRGNVVGISDGDTTNQGFATVGGGLANKAKGLAATVAGGASNVSSGQSAVVGGGSANVASGESATISGGESNKASAQYASVVGGDLNTASGSGATVGGGQFNCAGGLLSWAGGNQARVRPGTDAVSAGSCIGVPLSGDADGDNGTFVWADSQPLDFISTGPRQFLLRASGGVGMNTTAIPDSSDLVLANRTSALANVDLLMRSNGGPNGMNFAMSPDPAGAALYVAQYNGTTYTDRLIINPNGDFFVTAQAFKPGGGSWSVSSDARLKRDVQPLGGALERLLKLNGVTFQYTNPDPARRPAGTHIGLIAQDVEKVFPEWVGTDSDGYLTVGSKGFEALAVEALRDLRNEKNVEIAALASENAELRGRLERVEKTLEQLARRER